MVFSRLVCRRGAQNASSILTLDKGTGESTRSALCIQDLPYNSHLCLPVYHIVKETIMDDYQIPQSKIVCVQVHIGYNCVAAYQRTLHTRLITFTCAICGKEVTQHRFPGSTPRYCSEECQKEGFRIKNCEGARRRRQTRRVQRSSNSSDG